MLKFSTHRDPKTGHEWIETDLTGKALLVHALLNKGTAFTEAERRKLKLLGKLPFRVETLEEQLARTRNQYNRYSSVIQKYIYLNNLHDKNEVLFYRLLLDNLADTLPLIYTPGVSAAVQAFSHEFRQPRGLYIAYPDRENLNEILDNRTHSEIDLLVVTDGERILGIGDQGIGGMDIPIAKLVLYSLCGVDPYKTVPIMLDVGTDNPHLLKDPLYLGWRHPRLRGKEYDEFIKKFVEEIKVKFPNSFLHWEDFGHNNARRILETYRKQHCSFNDDMQGTGVVTLAALLAAVAVTKTSLKDHRIVILGAGTAGVGIADQLYDAMVRQGCDSTIARRQFWLVDKQGLLIEGMADLNSFQQPYARLQKESWSKDYASNNLLAVVKEVKPTILIGCSTVGNAFNEEIVREMAKATSRPIIFPLSNPTQNSEAFPEKLLEWTDGQALIATGSPFEPVDFRGKIYHITQCNNAYSFPGIGLGVIASKAREVTDNMLWAAAQAIAEHSPARLDPAAPLLPLITEIREVACAVALAVAKQAVADKVARHTPDFAAAEFVNEHIWQPHYREIRLAE